MTTAPDWARELDHSWPLLRARSSTEVTTAPLPLVPDTDPVRIGVDGTGIRHLLVPVGDSNVRGDDAESALAVRVRTYTFGRVPLRYVDIVCLRPDLNGPFNEVLVDVLNAVADDPKSAARAAVDVVARWRALLGTRRGRLLTLVGQLSLFAELTVLDLATHDRALDVSWWRGPLREPHDIVLPDRALEVKAVGMTSTTVEIHGVHQLEPPGMPLALVLATVSESDGGTTLPALVEEILNRVDNRGETVRRLGAAGYSGSDADRYVERFAVTDLGVIEVTEALPRIVPTSFGDAGIPHGVDGVAYRIGLDALDPHTARGETALNDWIGRPT